MAHEVSVIAEDAEGRPTTITCVLDGEEEERYLRDWKANNEGKPLSGDGTYTGMVDGKPFRFKENFAKVSFP